MFCPVCPFLNVNLYPVMIGRFKETVVPVGGQVGGGVRGRRVVNDYGGVRIPGKRMLKEEGKVSPDIK